MVDASARGQRIARARRRRGLSQAALAGLAGRSESWLSPGAKCGHEVPWAPCTGFAMHQDIGDSYASRLW